MESGITELEGIMQRAEAEARLLANEFARAAQGERESILAALESEQWLADGCRALVERKRERQV